MRPGALHGARRRLELLEHAVDEALDRARRLEPEAQQDRVGSRRSRRSASSIEPIASSSVAAGRAASGAGRRSSLGEHELQKQQRAPLANVLDRLGEPVLRPPRGRPASRGRSCGSAPGRRARCPAGAIRPPLLEDLERAVDERPGQRPDRAELARRCRAAEPMPSRARAARRAARARPTRRERGRVRSPFRSTDRAAPIGFSVLPAGNEQVLRWPRCVADT